MTYSEPVSFGPDRQAIARSALNRLVVHYNQDQLRRMLDLSDWLSLETDNGTGWLTGISELSVSFRPGQPVTIRCLAEILERRTMNRDLITAGLHWGMQMLNAGSLFGRSSYAISLFREVYEMVYLREPADPPPKFRFGIATEFGAESLTIKAYFDLHATTAERRCRTLEGIANLLEVSSDLNAWSRTCPVNFDNSRVIGLDFGPGDMVRSKFYWGARYLTWKDIRAASRELFGEIHIDTLRYLEEEIVSEQLSSVLISRCSVKGKYSMKLDVCVARLFQNDGEAYKAIERFRAKVNNMDHPAPLKIITGGLEPHETKCVQQYLGVELESTQVSRVTIYYRPVGLYTEHLNPVLRPRRCSL